MSKSWFGTPVWCIRELDSSKSMKNPLSSISALQIPLLRDSDKPINEEGKEDIENDECPQDTKIAPTIAVVHIEESKVLVGVAERAELAMRGPFRTRLQRPSQDGNVGREVSGAVLPWQSVEAKKLVRCTHKIRVCDCGRKHARYQICQWGDPIHEDPESRQLVFRGKDTTKYKCEREQDIRQCASHFSRADAGNRGVCEGRCVDHELEYQEEHLEPADGD